MQRWKIVLDMAAGQRVINDTSVLASRVIVTSISPSVVANACDASSASSALFVLDPFDGSYSKAGATIDTNHDGKIDKNDNATDAVVSLDGLGAAKLLNNKGGQATVITSGKLTVGATPPVNPLVQLGKTSAMRQWRQISTPPSY